MKIWITGGAGFLGTRLTQHFTGSGAEVISLSRRTSPFASKSVQLDLANDREVLNSLLSNDGPPDVVIHSASKQPGPGSDREFLLANVLTTVNLLDALK